MVNLEFLSPFQKTITHLTEKSCSVFIYQGCLVL